MSRQIKVIQFDKCPNTCNILNDIVINTEHSTKQRRKKMKKVTALFCALSILVAPIALYADEAATVAAAKPPQFITKNQYVDNTNMIKEAASVDWVTGKGRKDGVLRWAVDDNYLKKVPGMFGRGISNVSFGWVDAFTGPIYWSKDAPLGLGIFMGIVMGPLVAILRTTSGAIDIAIGNYWNLHA